jgi:hypothetical protein
MVTSCYKATYIALPIPCKPRGRHCPLRRTERAEIRCALQDRPKYRAEIHALTATDDHQMKAEQSRVPAARNWLPTHALMGVSSAATNPVGSGIPSISDSSPSRGAGADFPRLRSSRATENQNRTSDLCPRQGDSPLGGLYASHEVNHGERTHCRSGPAISLVPAVRKRPEPPRLAVDSAV